LRPQTNIRGIWAPVEKGVTKQNPEVKTQKTGVPVPRNHAEENTPKRFVSQRGCSFWGTTRKTSVGVRQSGMVPKRKTFLEAKKSSHTRLTVLKKKKGRATPLSPFLNPKNKFKPVKVNKFPPHLKPTLKRHPPYKSQTPVFIQNLAWGKKNLGGVPPTKPRQNSRYKEDF